MDAGNWTDDPRDLNFWDIAQFDFSLIAEAWPSAVSE
jgi:hypothetical protein